MPDIFKSLKCIGIMGGTFNPVHNGHILMAKTAHKQFPEIEKIIFMPNNIPKYKESKAIVDVEHRVKMLNIALSDYSWVDISDLEIRRGGITYTYDTLCQIRDINHGIKIYFIIGSDSLNTFRKWYRYKEVLSMCTLLVASRNNEEDTVKLVGEKLIEDCKVGHIEYLAMEEYDAASSDIRESISEGNMPFSLLPEGVPEYITSNNLYR